MAPLPPSPRVGVGVVIRRGTELLLQRRKSVHGAGTWSTPGGHLDFGEDPTACAVREVAEETGLTAERVEFVGATNDVFGSERHYITLWFAEEGVSGDATVAAPYEMSELGWFRRDSYRSRCFRRCAACSMGMHSALASGVISELNVIVAAVAVSGGWQRLGRRRLTRFRMSTCGLTFQRCVAAADRDRRA